jgi:hypothetical protein
MLTDSPSPILSEQLRLDEKLLWYGKPKPMRLARFQITQVIFGVFWIAIVLFMFNFIQNNFGSSRSSFGSSSFGGFQSIFSLVLLAFIVVGLWMISTPVRNYIKALNTYYGVTNERAIIVSKLFSTSIASYTKRDIHTIRRTAFGDGSGDVIFGQVQRTYTDYDDRNSLNVNFGEGGMHVSSGRRRRTVTVPVGFFGISDHQAVEALMQKTFVEDEAKN